MQISVFIYDCYKNSTETFSLMLFKVNNYSEKTLHFLDLYFGFNILSIKIEDNYSTYFNLYYQCQYNNDCVNFYVSMKGF